MADHLLAMESASIFGPMQRRAIKTAACLLQYFVGKTTRYMPEPESELGHSTHTTGILRFALASMEDKCVLNRGYDEATRDVVRDKIQDCINMLERSFDI